MSFDHALARNPGSRDNGAAHRNRAPNADTAAREASRLPGRPLEPTTRATMERRFGHDFAHVRVHADDSAAVSARGLDALAYTVDRHIVFGAGQYAPATAWGQRSLAHELAHVVQRDRGSSGASTGAGEEALEADARQAAEVAARGQEAAVCYSASNRAPLRQAAPAPAPSRPQREERFNIGRGGHRVDAELDRSIGWLTAKMKVKFNPVNSPLPWPSPARFAQFQSDFIASVTKRWSFKHFLVPDRACPGEPQRVAVRLQVIPVTSGQHFTVNVGYTTSYRQSTVGGRSATLDVLDVKTREDIPQTPGEHEFGHMLGLPHIHCARSVPECYGTTREERADILGEGSYVSPRDYQPFAELMPYFTGCNYRVVQASQIPTSPWPNIGGAIGALVGGVGLGLAGMAIGAVLGPVGALVGGLIGAIGGGIGGFFAGRAIATPRVPS